MRACWAGTPCRSGFSRDKKGAFKGALLNFWIGNSKAISTTYPEIADYPGQLATGIIISFIVDPVVSGYITGNLPGNLYMGHSQKRAVRRYRKRQKESGNVRVEVNVPSGDSPLIRDVAANLRAGGELAERIRTALKSVLSPWAGMNLKELVENAPPLDDLDLERSKELPRDVEL